jgi:hypothetical protein
MRKVKAEDRNAVAVPVADEGLERDVDQERTDYSALGSHVASVLEAATAAAARLRDEAEAEAARVLENAGRDAAATIREAASEAANIARDAETLRVEAEEVANTTRQRAEAVAEKQRRDADARAAEILRNAEEVAARENAQLLAREQALRESVQLAEGRLQHLVGGLRELAERLEEVITAETLEGWNATPEALDDALKESLRKQ